jgi:hypothetical protein
MYGLRCKLVSLLAQASIFFQACQAKHVCPSKKTLAYYEICPFSLNYECTVFYNTGPRVTIVLKNFIVWAK